MSGHHKCVCGCRESDHATDFECCTTGCPCKWFVARGAVPCSYCGTPVDDDRREAVDGRYHDEGQCLEDTAAALGWYKRDLAQAGALLREEQARALREEVRLVAALRVMRVERDEAREKAWLDAASEAVAQADAAHEKYAAWAFDGPAYELRVMADHFRRIAAQKAGTDGK